MAAKPTTKSKININPSGSILFIILPKTVAINIIGLKIKII